MILFMNKKLLAALIAVGAAVILIAVFVFAGMLDGSEKEPTDPNAGSASQGTTQPSGADVEDWDDLPGSTTAPTQPQATAPTTESGGDDSTVPGDDDTQKETDPTIPTDGDTSDDNATEPVKPSEPVPPPETTVPPETTTPPETSLPTEPDQPSEPPERDPSDYTYEEYNAMSAQERQAFTRRFESIAAFWDWYDAAKAQYDSTRETIEIGGGDGIDLGDLIGGNG